MKLKSLKILVWFVASLAFASTANAQEIYESEDNPHSVRPVRPADIMYKKTVWLRMDLKDKVNTPFFAKEHWISKLIIEAVKSTLLRPYKNDSLTTRMTNQEFMEKIKRRDIIENSDPIDDWGGGDSGWGGGWGDTGTASAATQESDELDPEDISLLDVKVDMIFDKCRGMWIRDIQSLTLVLPADMNGAKGVEDPIASFSYKELVDNLFDQNKEAIWFNEQNTAENKNLAEAFDLSLYNAKVTKFTDAKGRDIFDIYNDEGRGEIALIKGQQYQYQLLEYESNLWSN
ncbi:gliding motility protein GldN [Limibacter armeniacum]|uniref:type IX secretion system ring protein PorN/GldN n=1 Tax=Limibacter armeniacum TaxID=466084 RepID=UPI002FE552AC